MKTKMCTSIEQSKKLLELGLDPNTADMFYLKIPNSSSLGYNYSDYPYFIKLSDQKENKLPSWTLETLLNLLPEIDNYGASLNRVRIPDGLSSYFIWVLEYKGLVVNNREVTVTRDTPINLAYKMICWLLEQGYIKTEKKCID